MVVNDSLRKKGAKSFWSHLVRDRGLVLLLLPGLIYYLIFHYAPLYGILIAFKNYKSGSIMAAKWVGLKWFKQFFSSFYLGRTLGNTLRISLLNLVIGFPIPIIFALLLNEIQCRPYKKIVQTVSYLPHFVTTVIIVGIMQLCLNADVGVINNLLEAAGKPRINFMSESSWFLPLYIGSGIWQQFGWNSIIYMAALSSADPALYEAAKIDGANRWQQMLHVSLPCILPTAIILLLMQLGKTMSVGYEKIILMYNPGTYEVADTISTYVYRQGIVGGMYSFATAVDLFNSVCNVLILVLFNSISKRISEVSLW